MEARPATDLLPIGSIGECRYQDFSLDRLDFALLSCLLVIAMGSLVFQLDMSVCACARARA